MTVTRPWGTYTILDEGDGFKVKRLVIHPGQSLSYQSHKQRSEHWTIVAGTGIVTLDDIDKEVRTGDVVSIASGTKHRLRNDSTEDLLFIEVQNGHYLGEDDEIRYKDDYGREGTTEPKGAE
jgi:mannose-6-phosphate isomerase-like protein (cupin superfamily)